MYKYCHNVECDILICYTLVMAQYYKSNRGKDKLAFEGYNYVVDKVVSGFNFSA